MGVFRGVEFGRNFFTGSLRAVKEMSALKSLEMLIAAEREFFFCNYTPIISFLGVFHGVESAPNFFIGSLCALNEIPALKSLEMLNGDTTEFFFHKYPPIISFLGVFRGVESAPNFFIGSLCAPNEIPGLNSLEMPDGDTRECFFRNCPPIISCLRVFRGVESAHNFSWVFYVLLKKFRL